MLDVVGSHASLAVSSEASGGTSRMSGQTLVLSVIVILLDGVIAGTLKGR